MNGALELCISPHCLAGECKQIAQMWMCKIEMNPNMCLYLSHLCILASLLTLINKMPFLR